MPKDKRSFCRASLSPASVISSDNIARRKTLAGSGVGGNLFDLGRSRTRAAVLRELFAEPHAEWHVRGLAAATGEAVANVHRELGRLRSGGWLSVRKQANRVLYRVDEQHPLYREARSLVGATVGVPAMLREALAPVPGVRFALLGARPSGLPATSSLAVLVIGSASAAQVYEALRPAALRLQREIDLSVMDDEGLRLRLRRQDPVMRALLEPGFTVLVGEGAGPSRFRPPSAD